MMVWVHLHPESLLSGALSLVRNYKLQKTRRFGKLDLLLSSGGTKDTHTQLRLLERTNLSLGLVSSSYVPKLNRCPSHHLRTETDPAAETSSAIYNSERRTESRTAVTLSADVTLPTHDAFP
jgi:hypothetical protein